MPAAELQEHLERISGATVPIATDEDPPPGTLILVGFHDQDESDWSLAGVPTRIVRARLEWDVRTDVDSVLDDYFSRWFGPAARAMKEYHGLLERLDRPMQAAEEAATADPEASRLRIDKLIHENLREYVAMQKEKAACRFRRAAARAARMIEIGMLLRPGERSRIAVRVLCNVDVWGADGIYERPFLYAKRGVPQMALASGAPFS